MQRSVPREWSQYEYKDARNILSGLRRLQGTLPLVQMEYKLASLRTRALRSYLEGRQAALFCYGIGQLLGVEVCFAQVERQDLDIVTRRRVGDELVYTPVQLKELVPDSVNNQSSLQLELDKLKKYVDSKDLVVAFHINRNARIVPPELVVPVGVIGELWIYGAVDERQERWRLLGNLLEPEAKAFTFAHPTAA